jgi:hypothetical protein
MSPTKKLLWTCLAGVVFGTVARLVTRTDTHAGAGHESGPPDDASLSIDGPEPVQEIISEVAEIAVLVDRLRGNKASVDVRAPSVDSEVGAPVAQDLNWEKMPRESWALGSYLLLLPTDISADLFFRHVLLNPRDQRLGINDQEELRATLDLVGERFRLFVDAQSRMATLDSESASASDLTELPRSDARVVPGEKPGEITYEVKLNFVGLWSFQDGKGYRVRSPNFDSTLKHRAFLIEEVGSAITEWFRVRGCCTQEEANAIIAEIFATAETAYVRQR